MRGLDLKDVLEIPPPITEENKDRYLAELSKTREADEWIERHSTRNKQDDVKIIQHRNTDPYLKKQLWNVLIIPEIIFMICLIVTLIVTFIVN